MLLFGACLKIVHAFQIPLRGFAASSFLLRPASSALDYTASCLTVGIESGNSKDRAA